MNKEAYITTMDSIGGFKAVMIYWNAEENFWEPWQTGIGAYETREEAEEEGRWWAADERLEFK